MTLRGYLTAATVVLSLILLMSSCGPVTDDESPEGLTGRAGNALESGRPAEAAELYTTALEKYPNDVMTPEWHLGRGRSLLQMGRIEEALSDAGEAERTALDVHTGTAAMLLTARARIAGGSTWSGVEVLRRLDTAELDRSESDLAIEVLRAALGATEWDDLIREPVSGWTQLFFLLEIESRYARQGDHEKAIMTGMEIDRLFPDAHDRYGRPDYGSPEEGAFVALVLPLTGSGSEYAGPVASGVELAFDLSGGLFRSVPDLVTFDFCGDNELLSETIGTLGANPRCLAVIGPLTSASVVQASTSAIRWSLPLLSPTATSASLDDYDDYVHRLVISQGDEAAAMAEYAVRQAGRYRLAVIHEFTAESVAATEQFTAVAEELGAEIVGTEGYETGSTDFRDQINAIKYRNPDGIFLPVTAWDAIQLAPQLRFYRVDADLFGTSGWDDEILVVQGGEYVEGAVFPVSFGSSSINPETARFTYFYEREYETAPTMLSAQGYDAARIILGAWEGSVPTRSSLERHLEGLGIYFGATGICTIGQESIPRSSYPLVTVSDGEIISVE